MLKFRILFKLYWGHVSVRPLRELLALMGITAGVSLLFAVQVANNSITGSINQLAEGVTGDASLEVATRTPAGFNQNLFKKVERTRNVDRAAAVIERRIAVRGPKGRRPLTLVGFDERLMRIGGSLTRPFARRSEDLGFGLYLTEPVAKSRRLSARERSIAL